MPPVISNQSNQSQSNSKKWIIVVVVALVFLAGLQFILGFLGTFFGPAKLLEMAIERETGKEVSISRDGETIKGEGPDGEKYEYSSASEDVSLPETWPDFIPVIDGSHIIRAGSFGHDIYGDTDGVSMLVIFKTSQSSSKVIAYYKEELAKSGFSLEMESAANKMTSASFVKKGERIAVVISTANFLAQEYGNDQEVVQITYNREKR